MNDRTAVHRPAPAPVQPAPGRAGRLAASARALRLRLRRRGAGATTHYGLLALGGLFAMLALAVMPFDALVHEAIKASGLPLLAVMRAITDVGKSYWYLVPAAVLFLLSAAADWTVHTMRGKARLARLFGRSAFLFAAVAVSGLLADGLKIIFGRSRPRLFETDGAWHFDPFTFGSAHASFPSGHATTMGAVTMVAMLWFPRWRWLILPLGVVLAVTRVPALAHYPSDVVAGFGLGLVYTLFLARWLAIRRVAFRIAGGMLLPRLRAGG